MTLNRELAALSEKARASMPAQLLNTMARGLQEIVAAGVHERALREGDLVPEFTLPDATGSEVSLASIVGEGSAIIVFYRGAWCPYCNLELRAYQKWTPCLRVAGVSIAAISPQLPDGSLSMQQKNSLEFPVLSDAGAQVARAFGVAFELPEALQRVYQGFGVDLPVVNGKQDWVLPIPATYVVNRNFRVVRAHVDPDYTSRMEPREAFLQALIAQAG